MNATEETAWEPLEWLAFAVLRRLQNELATASGGTAWLVEGREDFGERTRKFLPEKSAAPSFDSAGAAQS